MPTKFLSATCALCLSLSLIAPALAESNANAESADKAMSPSHEMMTAPNPAMTQPMIVVVRAEWCPACKKITPTLQGLMKDYQTQAQWVILDVSNKKSTAEAAQKAQELGLSDFFKKYGARTSTVAIIDPQSKKVLSLFMAESQREKYVTALDQARKMLNSTQS